MNKKNLIVRWNDFHVSSINMLVNQAHFQAQKSPFGQYNGRWDFRGFNFSSGEWRFIQNCSLTDIDFSESNFSHVRICNCFMNNVIFEKSKFEDTDIMDSDLLNCIFTSCSIRSSALGIKSFPNLGKKVNTSKIVNYHDCTFDNCNFKKAIFSRAAFYNCNFLNNKYKDTDFGVSSFNNCVFTGKVEDVIFRGDYDPFNLNLKKSDVIPNPMKISFENAELISVEYSFNCNLSNVIMPLFGKYIRFNEWGNRLKYAIAIVSQWKDSDYKKELLQKLEIDHYIQKAKDQSWNIINIDELNNILGDNFTRDYIKILSDYNS